MRILCLLSVLATVHVYGSFSTWTKPWTKSFLEVRVDGFLEHTSVNLRKSSSDYSKNKNIGTVTASGAPLPNWEISALLSAADAKSRKLGARIEHQILSDLKISPIALTTFLEAFDTTRSRASEPAFFEMAKRGGEIGIGLGRHLGIAPLSYTQLFGYLTAGIGSSWARWTKAEIGFSHLHAKKHGVRLSYQYTRPHSSKSGSFRGFGSQKADIQSFTAGYTYITSGGFQWKLAYIYRHFQKGVARSSQTAHLGISLPLAL